MTPNPCPFCGNDELDVDSLWAVPGGYVRCECGGMMQKVDGTIEEAVAAWNEARPLEDDCDHPDDWGGDY